MTLMKADFRFDGPLPRKQCPPFRLPVEFQAQQPEPVDAPVEEAANLPDQAVLQRYVGGDVKYPVPNSTLGNVHLAPSALSSQSAGPLPEDDQTTQAKNHTVHIKKERSAQDDMHGNNTSNSGMLQTHLSQQVVPMEVEPVQAAPMQTQAQVYDQSQAQQVQATPQTVPVSEDDAALDAALDAASVAAEEQRRKNAALLEKKAILEMEKAREEERVRKKKEATKMQYALRYQKRGGGGGRRGGRW